MSPGPAFDESGRGESNPHLWLGEPTSWPFDHARASGRDDSLSDADTLASVRMRVFWPVTIAAALLVGLLAYGIVARQTDTTLDDAGAHGQRPAAPSTMLPRLQGGGDASLADYRGKVVILNMWASWCDPCRQEVPLLQKTEQQIQAKGGTVL